MRAKSRFGKMKKPKTFFLSAYFILISLIFGMTATYAWFSSILVNLGGNLGLRNLSAIARIYENYDDSANIDNFIDGLTDAKVIVSNGTNLTAFNMIEKKWYSNVCTSIYLEVENTGTINLKSILKTTYDNDNITTFLSYYYYQVVDITQNVSSLSFDTNREKLAQYNADYQLEIEQNVGSYINNIVENGTSITSNLTTINMDTTVVGSSTFYRLDIAVAEMPTELLTQYNALLREEREIKINSIITIKQENAPNDDSQESGTSVYVSSADAFISAVYGASNGDNIYLSNNIIISRNITITRRINIYLNGYNLSIAGNFAYDVAVAGSITLDVSNNSVLSVYGDLIIDAPNATFRLLGSGGAHSVILGTVGQGASGRFYVNCLLDENNTQTYGYYQYGVTVSKRTSEGEELATMTVDSKHKSFNWAFKQNWANCFLKWRKLHSSLQLWRNWKN